MRKELLTSLVFTAAYFLLISVVRNWFNLMYLPFWIGGIVGLALPLVDYLITVYVLRTNNDISQVAQKLSNKNSVLSTLENMSKNRVTHNDLIFHTAHFQMIFLVFSFWIMSSSGSLFGMGLTLAFLLHLLIDQVNDFSEVGTIKHWFNKLNLDLSKKDEKFYLIAHVIFIVVLGFFI